MNADDFKSLLLLLLSNDIKDINIGSEIVEKQIEIFTDAQIIEIYGFSPFIENLGEIFYERAYEVQYYIYKYSIYNNI